MGLHVDIDAILLDNRAKQNVCRKGGLVINDGDNPTKKEINLKRERNKQKYGLGAEFVSKLQLPKTQTKEWLKVLTLEQIYAKNVNFSTTEKLNHLGILQEALQRKLQKVTLRSRYMEHQHRFRDCHLVVEVSRVCGVGLTGHEMFEYSKLLDGAPEKQSMISLFHKNNVKLLEERRRREQRHNSADVDMPDCGPKVLEDEDSL